MGSEEYIRSRRRSAPLEWVSFEAGQLAVFRYASGKTDVTYEGDLYQAVAMKRTSPQLSQEINQSGVQITLPRDSAIWQMYKYNAPTVSCRARIYGKQADDPTVYQVFKGFVSGFTEKGSLVEIQIESEISALKRIGLRYLYSPKCAFFVYDGRCPVPKSAFATETTITGVSADDLSISASAFAAKPDGYFALGWVETPDGERSMIVSHTGSTLILIKALRESPSGKTVTAYAGCDLEGTTCRDKFGAYTNGGRDRLAFPLVPQKTPSEGIA